MIYSVLLEEKYRVQKKLAEEVSSAHNYLKQSHLAAQNIAKSYGLSLQYVSPPVETESRDRASDSQVLNAKLG